MPTPPYVVGIDLGGTNMQVGIVDADRKLLGRSKAKTKADRGGDAVVDRMIEAVEEACDSAGIRVKDLLAVGVGAPGAIDMIQGVVVEAPNLRWTNMPLAKRLSDGLEGRPVLLDNDVNVAVYGENIAGAGAGARDVLGVWIGTGIGGGLVLNGQLYYGGFGTAGEIGQAVIFPGAPLGWRTLEQNCSRKYLVERLLSLIHSNHPSMLLELSEGKEDIGASTLALAYNKGDDLVRRVLDEATELLGLAISQYVTVLSLPMVILGGGLAEAMGQSWADRVAASMRRHVFPKSLQACKVVTTALADDAGLFGAALLALNKFKP